MKKSFRGRTAVAVPLLLAVLLLTSACGGGYANLSFELKELGETLLGAGLFSDEMLAYDTDAAVSLYGLTGVSEAAAWAGSGAFAEEIVLVKSDDPHAAYQKLQDRLASQKTVFTDYKAEEMPKLKSAVLMTAGDSYAIYVVSNDNAKADELIASFLKSHAK